VFPGQLLDAGWFRGVLKLLYEEQKLAKRSLVGGADFSSKGWGTLNLECGEVRLGGETIGTWKLFDMRAGNSRGEWRRGGSIGMKTV